MKKLAKKWFDVEKQKPEPKPEANTGARTKHETSTKVERNAAQKNLSYRCPEVRSIKQTVLVLAGKLLEYAACVQVQAGCVSLLLSASFI